MIFFCQTSGKINDPFTVRSVLLGKFIFAFKLLLFFSVKKLHFKTQHIMENLFTNSVNYNLQVLPEPKTKATMNNSEKKKRVIPREDPKDWDEVEKSVNKNFKWAEVKKCTDKNFKCTLCDKSYNTQKLLKSHLCMRKFACKICPEVGFSFQQHYNSHMQTVHQGFKCEVCDKKFQWPGYLRTHHNMVHKKQTFPCHNCDQIFAHTRYLRKHLTSAHQVIQNGRNGYKCDICNKLFSENGYLTIHKKTVHGPPESKNDEANRCVFCTNKQFKTKYDLRRHLRNVHKFQDPPKNQQILPTEPLQLQMLLPNSHFGSSLQCSLTSSQGSQESPTTSQQQFLQESNAQYSWISQGSQESLQGSPQESPQYFWTSQGSSPGSQQEYLQRSPQESPQYFWISQGSSPESRQESLQGYPQEPPQYFSQRSQDSSRESQQGYFQGSPQESLQGSPQESPAQYSYTAQGSQDFSLGSQQESIQGSSPQDSWTTSQGSSQDSPPLGSPQEENSSQVIARQLASIDNSTSNEVPNLNDSFFELLDAVEESATLTTNQINPAIEQESLQKPSDNTIDNLQDQEIINSLMDIMECFEGLNQHEEPMTDEEFYSGTKEI